MNFSNMDTKKHSQDQGAKGKIFSAVVSISLLLIVLLVNLCQSLAGNSFNARSM